VDRFEVYKSGIHDIAPESLHLPAMADKDARHRKIEWKKRLLLDLLGCMDRDIGNYEREVMETEGLRAVVNKLRSQGVDHVVQTLAQMYHESLRDNKTT
jgi:hypothetical protein